jgi:hypothetical protein
LFWKWQRSPQDTGKKFGQEKRQYIESNGTVRTRVSKILYFDTDQSLTQHVCLGLKFREDVSGAAETGRDMVSAANDF